MVRLACAPRFSGVAGSFTEELVVGVVGIVGLVVEILGEVVVFELLLDASSCFCFFRARVFAAWRFLWTR